MEIRLKRAYEDASPGDGARVLVERLWPRGVTKERAQLDLWAKDVAPSAELRKWYSHDAAKWEGFRERYVAELESHDEALQPIFERVSRGTVTFVFGSSEERRNSATVLKEYVERVLGGPT